MATQQLDFFPPAPPVEKSRAQKASAPKPANTLHDLLSAFCEFGEQTLIEQVDGVPRYINEFWTARQRQGHPIHEVSYRACFKPQLPEFFINLLTAPGDTVYDPFMGRGTTPVQAHLMGRNAWANDINPLSTLLTRPRLSPPDLKAIAARLAQIDWAAGTADPSELLVFYHPETLVQITALRDYLLARTAMGLIDPVDDWIRMVAINRLTGHSSGFFSVYSLPPNQAVSVESQRKINEKRQQTPPLRDVAAIILKKSKGLLKTTQGQATASHRLQTGPADQSGLPPASVDLVVTSPPFLDIVQYAADNWLRCWFAGIDTDAVKISMHRKVEQWQAFTANVLSDLARIVRPGGHIAYEVGEVRGGEIRLEDHVLAAAAGLPLEPVCVVINAQEFTKTANCWGVSNNAKGTNTNRIVVLKRR
jgi:hypothetical protein